MAQNKLTNSGQWIMTLNTVKSTLDTVYNDTLLVSGTVLFNMLSSTNTDFA